jgi:hypothetical protein
LSIQLIITAATETAASPTRNGIKKRSNIVSFKL